jgi:hypothetical protein
MIGSGTALGTPIVLAVIAVADLGLAVAARRSEGQLGELRLGCDRARILREASALPPDHRCSPP